jgi:hypothetical protein
MLPIHVALVSRTGQTTSAQLEHVAAALQMQAIRDVGPLWSLTATVDAFESLRDVPVGSWPVVVVDDVKGAAGYHLDSGGQPYALVEVSDSWSLTASHETVEMVVDPWGRRIAPGRSPKRGQGQVEFLVEACDPCEAAEFAYTINGVLVSDFVTPHFYDPRQTVGARYSFTGAVKRPRQILRGGYISWHEPRSDHIWQQLWLDGAKSFKDLGEGDFPGQGSLRGFVDEHTAHPDLDHGLPEDDHVLADARAGWKGAIASAQARGTRLEEEIEAVLA